MSRPSPLGLPLAPVPKGFPGRVEFIKSAGTLEQAPHTDLPEVCICGRSNVGKSSLINTICKRRQLARTSSTPGRTQLINFFDVQGRLCLVDLPGYGWARVPAAIQARWGTTIQRYLEDRPQLCLALLLVDIRRDPGPKDADLLAWFRQGGRACLIVATKADKIASSRRHGRLAAIARALAVPVHDVLPFAAPTRLGREAIWGAILAQSDRAADSLQKAT